MGMFDSLFDAAGDEWQTKAFECNLDEYRIGDPVPADSAASYQVEVLGGFGRYPDRLFVRSFATIRGGVLVAVNDPRDEQLPLLNYSGHVVASKGTSSWTSPTP